jgi:hypothetical protein
LMPRVCVVAMAIEPPNSSGNDNVRLPERRSGKYSLPKAAPIFRRQVDRQGAVDGPASLGSRPAGLVVAEVGAAPGHPPRIDDHAAIRDTEPVQLAARLDPPATDTGANGLRSRRGSPPRRERRGPGWMDRPSA